MPPRHWLSQTHPIATLLRPVAWCYGTMRKLRECLYRWKIFKTTQLSVPVIVVGNVVAGGVGKTPVVIALVARLVHMGYQPGVISRGYGRKSKSIQLVTQSSTSAEVGDEPLLISQACQVPVAVGVNRVDAAKVLLGAYPSCNLLVSDDGLQHLALGRDIEIVLFDERGVGNSWLLPAGPLREPWPRKPRCRAHMVLNDVARSLASYAIGHNGQHLDLRALTNQTPHALAGIAKPDHFFEMLRKQGLPLSSTHPYPDHVDFSKTDAPAKLAATPDGIWLCTQKDAVKLWPLLADHAHRVFAVPLVIDLDATFLSVFDVSVQTLMQSHHHL